MPEPSKSIWYHLGYALESARRGAQAVQSAGKAQTGGKVRSGGKTRSGGKGRVAKRARSNVKDRSAEPRPVSSAVDQLIATGTGILGDRLFSLVAGRRPGGLRLTRAALAGAGAALALSLFRNGTNGKPGVGQSPYDPTAEILTGAARGMLYGAVLEPRLPGSPLLRGATFGIMEYVTSPFGGLDGILGASSPHRTLPILAALLGTGDSEDGSESVSMAHHIAFGVTLGLLYGEGSARRGRRAAE
ncbi:MAG: hypothetical protein IH921_09275 [Gemmatimonadetes bacterium]|nr:hypothetical protein [Gemmatimonadota bacterium]